MKKDIEPGEELYSVAAGRFPLAPWKLKRVSDFLEGLEGFRGVHFVEDGRSLLFFDGLNNAKIARNLIEAQGNDAGRNICLWRIADDGVPEFVEGAE